MSASLLLLALSLPSFASVEPAEKATIFLTDHVDMSDFVCIGSVEEIIPVTVPGRFVDSNTGWIPGKPTPYPYAKVRVERVIKGDPKTKYVFHEAWSAWICDSTGAVTGERSLFLLHSVTPPKDTPDHVRELIRSALGGTVAYRNVGSGDGIIPIHGEPGSEYVHCAGAPAAFEPKQPPYESRLSDVLAHVEIVARFNPEAVAIHAHCSSRTRLAPDKSKYFELRILPDGSRRLATRPGPGETVTVDKMEPNAWKRLQSDLSSALGDQQGSLGNPQDYYAERKLRIRLDRSSMNFVQDRDFDPKKLDEAAQTSHIRALRSWALIRASLECPECMDLSEADRRWIESR